MQPSTQLKKNKSKTTLMQKFVDKFKKKRKVSKSPSCSRERSSEEKSRKKLRSPSKVRHNSQTTQNAPSTSKMAEVKEVSAKGIKEKEKKSTKSVKEKKEKKKKSDENPAPSKSPSMVALRAAETQLELAIHKEKVEKSVKAWIEVLAKIDIKKVLEQEFKGMLSMKVAADKCTVFFKKQDMCQSDHLEVLDTNRVKIEGNSDFFYHGTVVTVPAVTSKTVVLAQLPIKEDTESIEAFWLMVAGVKIQRVFVLLGEGELDKKTLGGYFPEDFAEHPTIRVNNRKTQLHNEEQTNDQLYYEVVPKDCAEAPFAMIEICDFWSDAKIPTNTGRAATTAASVFDSDVDPDATIGVVSHFGAGRAGAFIVGALAIERMRGGEIPNIKELTTNVRSQRPGAVETLSQYVFSHILPLTYSMKQVSNQSLKSKIEKIISQLEQFAFGTMAEEEDEDEEPDGN